MEQSLDQTHKSSEYGSKGPSRSPSSERKASPSLPAEEVPPPLPSDEISPPLPDEAPPGQESEDDGWEPVWDDIRQAYYFYNRVTQKTQWENPRVPDTNPSDEPQIQRPHGGYDPAIHGSYDPNASYAVEARERAENAKAAADAAGSTTTPDYSASGHFNRFTGKWQSENQRAENYSDEAKSARQMNAFFDVDAAANSHSGRSLKAERANKKLTKQELKAFKEKRKEKKEEKRRAWLKD